MESVLFSRVQHYASLRDFETAIFLGEQLLAACTHTRDALLHHYRPATSLQHFISSLLPSPSSSSSLPPPPSPSSPPLHPPPRCPVLLRHGARGPPQGLPPTIHLPSPPSLPPTIRPPSSPATATSSPSPPSTSASSPRPSGPSSPSPSSPPPPPLFPSCAHLLGLICERTARPDQAVVYYQQAIRLDPFLWAALARLAHLGAGVDTQAAAPPTLLFAFDAADVREAEADTKGRARAGGRSSDAPPPTAAKPSPAVAPAPSAAWAPPPSAKAASPATRSLAQSFAAATPATASLPSSFTQPSPVPLSLPNPSLPSPAPVASPPSRPATRHAAVASPPVVGGRHTRQSSASATPLVKGDRKRGDGQSKMTDHLPARKKAHPSPKLHSVGARSGREAAEKRDVSEVTEMDLTSDRPPPLQADERETEALEDPPPAASEERESALHEVEGVPDHQAMQRSADGLSAVLRTLAAAHSALCSYDSRLCLDLLSSLPVPHAQTPFALACLGRAHFDRLDYPAAISAFQRLLSRYPHHVEGLDVYSTALWQCKKDVALSALAQALTSRPHSPRTLSAPACVVLGNLFSLQRDHETAIRFFDRALQLDGQYAYAAALAGHEWAVMEDYAKGQAMYRQALSLDPRQYTAWYGLGHLLYQQEKWPAALAHFQQALAVHERSPLLRVYAALTLVAMGHVDEALRVLLEAVEACEGMGGGMGQVYFQLASVYAGKREWDTALQWCERVEEDGWREAAVHTLKGRVLKRMGRTQEALRSFISACDLDPKDGNGVKAVMEAMLTKKQTRGGRAGEEEDEDDDDDQQRDDAGF